MGKGRVARTECHIKGWGWEEWIVNNTQYCGKILHFKKGGTFSLHYHKIKLETFYVLRGKFKAELYDSPNSYFADKKKNKHVLTLREGGVVDIWEGRVHRLSAIEKGEIIEFSTHHYEDDSYRLEPGDSQRRNKNV